MHPQDFTKVVPLIGSRLRHEANNKLTLVQIAVDAATTGKELDLSAELRKAIQYDFLRFHARISFFSAMLELPTVALGAFQLLPIYKNVCESASVLCASAGIEFVSATIRTNPIVSCEPLYLRSVLLELVVNSCTALAKAPVKRIQLECAVEETNLRFRLTDNGPGVPNHELGSLFSIPATSTQNLGLPLSAMACTQMAGSLAYIPNSNMNGACFEITMPLPSTAK